MQGRSATPSPFTPLEMGEIDLDLEQGDGAMLEALAAQGGKSEQSELSLEETLRRARGLLEHVEKIESVVNKEREDQGLPALTGLPILRAIAFYRANDMAVRDYLSHTDPEDGTALAEELLIQEGFTGKLGELIWQSQSPLEALPVQAIEEWIRDPAQKSLIDDPSFRFTGAGLIWDGSNWNIVQVFAENSP